MITIYKSLVRHHLYNGAIIFHQAENESFCKKFESVQYNAGLAIAGAIRSSSRELGLETLKPKRWLRKWCCFYKIKNNGIPYHLAELIPFESHLCNTRNTRNFTTDHCRTDVFKYCFNNCLNPLCTCSLGVDLTVNFFSPLHLQS